MASPVETRLTISCLQFDWFVDATNASVNAGRAFLEAAYAHADQHEQHALEVVQRLRIYGDSDRAAGQITPRALSRSN